MLEFVILFGFSFLLMMFSIYFKSNDKIIVVIYIITVAIFAATRDLRIQDTQGYAVLYMNSNFDLAYNLSLTYQEIGFVFLSMVIKFFVGNNYQAYFFIITLINMSLILLGIKMFYKNEPLTLPSKKNFGSEKLLKPLKKEIKYVIPLVIYVSSFGYSFNFITLRIGLAFSLLFLAIAVSNKNKVISLLLYAISVTMHFSAWFALILVPFLFYKKAFSKKTYILWISMIPILLFLGYNNVVTSLFFDIAAKIPAVYMRFMSYLTNDIVADGSGTFIRMIVYILLAIYLIINNQNEIKYNMILKSYLVGLTILALFINITVIGRIVEVFVSFIFILPSYYISINQKRTTDVIVLILYFSYFAISMGRLISIVFIA